MSHSCRDLLSAAADGALKDGEQRRVVCVSGKAPVECFPRAATEGDKRVRMLYGPFECCRELQRIPGWYDATVLAIDDQLGQATGRRRQHRRATCEGFDDYQPEWLVPLRWHHQ